MFEFIKPEPDVKRFITTIKREEVPIRPPFVEMGIDFELMKIITEEFLGREWLDFSYDADREQRKIFWDNFILMNYKLGYDYVRIPARLPFPKKVRTSADTSEIAHGNREWAEEGKGAIST